MALAGFTPGQAEALRRAMSRKRSREAMLELWREFRDGARARGVDDETIRGVFTKLIGFSNFGFPKAHSSAFAVLAYQSAWLRQRYPAEFLASLLNAQPMGFYPPASLVRDAQRRGVRVLPPCIARADAVCSLEDGAVRVGLGYVREVRHEAAARLVAEREADGPFRDIADLAARSELRREQLAQLVRAGACDVFERPRRAMLWELGVLSRPRASARGTQLALPIPAAPAPPLPELSRFERTITDYETTGLSTGWHLVTLVRPGLPAGRPHGRASCARPPTAPTSWWPAWWWRASGRPRPGASSSCCSRTRPAWSTASCARRSTSDTARWCGPTRCSWPGGAWSATSATINVLVTRMERIEPPREDTGPAAAEVARR